jgi:hypothetical protein
VQDRDAGSLADRAGPWAGPAEADPDRSELLPAARPPVCPVRRPVTKLDRLGRNAIGRLRVADACELIGLRLEQAAAS